MAELDMAEQEAVVATFSNGANARTGTIPVNYDAARKKMTWYYFMGTAMTEAEMVRCPALRPLSVTHLRHQLGQIMTRAASLRLAPRPRYSPGPAGACAFCAVKDDCNIQVHWPSVYRRLGSVHHLVSHQSILCSAKAVSPACRSLTTPLMSTRQACGST